MVQILCGRNDSLACLGLKSETDSPSSWAWGGKRQGVSWRSQEDATWTDEDKATHQQTVSIVEGLFPFTHHRCSLSRSQTGMTHLLYWNRKPPWNKAEEDQVVVLSPFTPWWHLLTSLNNREVKSWEEQKDSDYNWFYLEETWLFFVSGNLGLKERNLVQL